MVGSGKAARVLDSAPRDRGICLHVDSATTFVGQYLAPPSSDKQLFSIFQLFRIPVRSVMT